MAADLALINGKIITVDNEDSVVEAIAVKGNKILKVGLESKIDQLIGRKTLVIDLKGKAVTPGFIDTHAHFSISGTDQTYVLNLRYPSVKSITEVVKLIEDKAKKMQRGEWIQGIGWDEALFEERRYLTLFDLNPVSPENPVILTHTSGHYVAVNTYSLKLAGVTKDTPQPNGGTIVKDLKTGEPTGVFLESPAINIVRNLVPKWTVKEVEVGIKKAQEEFLSEGITTVKDPGVGDTSLIAYQNLHRRGKLRIRIYMLYEVDSLLNTDKAVKNLTRGGDDTLKLGGLKMFLDGSGMGRTGWMWEDWNKNFTETDEGNRGYTVIKVEEFRRMIKLAHKSGFQIGVHAIGDRAVEETLSAYQEALSEIPTEDSRHSIIHAISITDKAFNMIEKLGNNVVIETQSPFLYFIGDNYAGNFGPERSKKAIPLKSLIKRNVIVGNGSDWSVCPFQPRYGLWGAVTRKTWKELYGPQPFGSEESVTVKDALRSYTIIAAKCLFMENQIGSIEVGKYADLAIWSKDPYSIPTNDLKDLRTEMTIVGGKIVYKASFSEIGAEN